MFKYKEFCLLWFNIILGLDKETRRSMLKNISKENKVKIFNTIPTLTDTLKLNHLEDYNSKVQKRNEHITKYPESVFWEYFEYQTEKKGLITLKNTKVSTRGEVVTLDDQDRLFIIGMEKLDENADYKIISRNGDKYSIHRLVGSIFKPRPAELEGVSFEYLQVNHLDKIKCNNELKNLEWVSKAGNIRHSLGYDDYQDYDNLLFTVLVDNGYKNSRFILNKLDVVKYFSSNEVMRCLRDTTGNHLGFRIEPIPKTHGNIVRGIPSEIEKLLLKDKNYFLPDIKPIIGEILKGPYKGLRFSLFGKAEVNKYFDQGAVGNICAGRRKTYKGCTFQYSTHREAIPLHGNLTNEIWEACFR